MRADVAVIGGGVIGHGIAWEARRSGRSVALIDDAPGSGASWAAAGMLAPVSELHYQEEDLLELMLESSRLWPAFAAGPGGAECPADDTGYLTTPTLAVGADAADRRALDGPAGVQQANGLAVEPLTVREARAPGTAAEPGHLLRLRHPGGPPGGSAEAGCVACGRRWRAIPAAGTAVAGATTGSPSGPCVGLLWQDGRVAGVQAGRRRDRHAPGKPSWPTGCTRPRLGGLPAGLRLPLRPVHGDILRLRVPEHLRPLLTSTVRGLVRGVPVYIVPRQDGTVVIGATQREDALGGQDRGTTPRTARPSPPAASTSCCGTPRCWCRPSPNWNCSKPRPGRGPATPDNAPLLGRVARCRDGGDIRRGLIIATGFFRHGVLLTPARPPSAGS